MIGHNQPGLGDFAFFPMFDLEQQAIQGGEAQNDHEVTKDIFGADLKAGVDHDGMLEFLIPNGDRAKHPFNGINTHARNRERNLDLEEITENTEAGIEQDIDSVEGVLSSITVRDQEL